ncbi:hypothetical protein LLG95_12240 [bacterium]|nr:hypothetical protein [bacterium]
MPAVQMFGGLPDLTILPIPVWIALGFIAMIVTVKLYFGLFEAGDRAWALELLLMSIVVSALYYGVNGPRYFYRLAFQRGAGFSRDILDQAMIAAVIFFMCAFPFAAKLYYKFGRKILSDAEKTPGLAGVRAWLSLTNVAAALIIATTAFIGSYEFCSFWLVFIGLLVVLLVYPVRNSFGQPTQSVAAQAAPAQAPQAPNLTDERERVLKLLEEGQISTEDSVELLNALTESARAEAASARPGMSPAQRVKMFGVAVLVIAFFMPWLNVNIAKEVERLTRTLTQSMSQMTGLPQEQLGNANIKITPSLTPGGASQLKGGNTIVLRGGDLNYGLGWAILLLGIAAAALPWIAPGMDAMTMRRVTAMAAAAGAILLLYVLFSNFRYATYGIVVALAGYMLIGIGLMKDIGMSAPGPAAVTNAEA